MAIDLNDKPWYVALIVGLVLGTALYVVMQMYVFSEIEDEITKLETSIDELEREIEKGRAAKADLPKLEEDIANYQVDLDRLRKILPTQRETESLIKKLKQLTEQGRFQLTKFQPADPKDRDFYLEWPIRVELDGTYHELGLFFDRLSNFSRIINVDDLSVRPNRGDDFTIHASFTQQTFIYKDDAQGGSP